MRPCAGASSSRRCDDAHNGSGLRLLHSLTSPPHAGAFSFLQVPPMSMAQAAGVLGDWLSLDKRRLTPEQRTAVLVAYEGAPLPLTLAIAHRSAMAWRSYSPPGECVLPTSLAMLVRDHLAALERRHCALLVSHALGRSRAVALWCLDNRAHAACMPLTLTTTLLNASSRPRLHRGFARRIERRRIGRHFEL